MYTQPPGELPHPRIKEVLRNTTTLVRCDMYSPNPITADPIGPPLKASNVGYRDFALYLRNHSLFPLHRKPAGAYANTLLPILPDPPPSRIIHVILWPKEL